MTQRADSMRSRRDAFGKASLAWWRGVISGQEIGIFFVLMAMVLYLMYKTDTFTSTQNVRNIWLSFSWIAIAAFGQTLVIITAGIDLSTGAVMGLSGLAAAYAISGNMEGQPTSWAIEKVINNRTQIMGPDKYVPIALIAGPMMGLLLGTISGILVAWGNLPPFIATLGMMSIARGVCYGWSSGWPFQKLNNEFLKIGQTNLPFLGYDVPYPFIIMIVIAILMTIFLTRTIWGYRIYAVGGNEQAAQLSGINTRRVKLMAFMLSGLMAGIGGTLMTARLGVAAPTAAQGYELDVIAAVFIGGASVTGGKGTIIGTLIGAATMQVLRSGLNLLGYDPYWQPAAIGMVIILAIGFDRLRVQLQGGRLYLVLKFDEVPAQADTTQIGRRVPVVYAWMGLAGTIAAILVGRVLLLLGVLTKLHTVSWIVEKGTRLWFPILIALIGAAFLLRALFDLWRMKRRGWVLAVIALLFSLVFHLLTYLSTDQLYFESQGLSAALLVVIAVTHVGFIGWFWLNRWRFVE